ncbi:unnamed protein product, partial [Ascophyllum nodosum]
VYIPIWTQQQHNQYFSRTRSGGYCLPWWITPTGSSDSRKIGPTRERHWSRSRSI